MARGFRIINVTPGGLEIDARPHAWIYLTLAPLLPAGSVVLHWAGKWALDLEEHGKRVPLVDEPLAWHDFVAWLS